MNTEERTRKRRVLVRRSAEDREQLIQEYEASGLTRRKFCAKRKINLMTFHGWFKKRPRQSSPQFTEVALPVGGTALIEIELPKGVCIRLRDPSALSEVAAFIREVNAC